MALPMPLPADPARRRALQGALALAGCALVPGLRAQPAPADAVERLRAFAAGVASGRARFEQTVTTPDGASRRASSGRFEFARPGRFRFDYERPYVQTIVSDGQRVWMHDPDLNQVTVRRFDDALGATPAALLAGAGLERDFVLAPDPPREGRDPTLAWARATPKAADGAFQWMAIGFRAALPERIEILDRFGQRTMLHLQAFEAGVALAPERFSFTPPPGADVVEQ